MASTSNSGLANTKKDLILTTTDLEIWLKTDNNAFRFPVLPPSFNINNSTIVDRAEIIKLGEVGIFGGSNLKTVQISSFFPSINYNFCSYSTFPTPYNCVKLLETWRLAGTELRFIITSTNINMPVIIESFSYGEMSGSRDVDFTLSLKEHKHIKITEIATPSGTTTTTNNRPIPTPTTQQKTHTVKKGDCLWDIAQKYYGKGSRYTEIKVANQSKYPSLKKNNIIYVGWVLILP